MRKSGLDAGRGTGSGRAGARAGGRTRAPRVPGLAACDSAIAQASRKPALARDGGIALQTNWQRAPQCRHQASNP